MSNIIQSIKSSLAPVHPEGRPFIAAFAAGAVVLAFIADPLGWLGAILTAWCAYFFRDPSRVTPLREGLVISPADGRIEPIVKAPPPPELDLGDEPMVRISVFMNVFDVHVNRSPVPGKVEKIAYRPGKFFDASLDKASEDNERMSLIVRQTDGVAVPVVQIAGLVARRIKCFVTEGTDLGAGQRFGLIRFGSRVDVYLPESASILVSEGQRALAGETVLADFAATEAPRMTRRD
ncbi:MAG: phosphatidylserine decarboxylase [Pseudomonadota bacterium]